ARNLHDSAQEVRAQLLAVPRLRKWLIIWKSTLVRRHQTQSRQDIRSPETTHRDHRAQVRLKMRLITGLKTRLSLLSRGIEPLDILRNRGHPAPHKVQPV